MKKSFLILVLLLAGCGGQSSLPEPAETGAGTAAPASAPAGSDELTVFAAASLTAAFEEIEQLFKIIHPEVTVVFNFAGSQQLAQQIIHGAPADVFASSNHTQMALVVEAGEIREGSQQVFAGNRLVVIFPGDNPAGIRELKDLAGPGLKLVFAAQEVPVGQYSIDFLEKASADPAFSPDYKDGVMGNVVSYEDNVKAVLTKVALGEADAGIVFISDISGEAGLQVGRLEIPNPLNAVASYPIAPVEGSDHPELAQAFIDLVLSPEGQNILAKYNFLPVK
jgi:molybdate transport system substrate-binding protein